jgi:hypothetical protein
MKVIGAAVAAMVLLVCAGDAFAGWSAPQSAPFPSQAASSIAVNARGDAVVAWARRHSSAKGPVFGTSVGVAVGPAWGRLRTRRIWSSKRAIAGNVAVAIDGRGEVTVAWIANFRRNKGGTTGNGIVYAAYGQLARHWTHPQRVGPGLTQSRITVAPHGRVLLLWVRAAARDSTELAVAFRARGHRFRAPRRLDRPHVVSTPYDSTGAEPAFDTRGAAYVAGLCDAVVLRARPGRTTFRTIFDRGPALGAVLSLAGEGNGVVSWVHGICTPDIATGNTPGPAFASVLRAGRFGPDVALPSTKQASGTYGVAAPGGGGVVSWQERFGIFTTQIDPAGALAPPRLALNGIAPYAVDGGGDQVLVGPGSVGQSAQFGVLVRPVAGGPDQPAPVSNGVFAVSKPFGRRVALAWSGGGDALALSVWRP